MITTDTQIKKIQPQEKLMSFSCGFITGLNIRVYPSNKKVFYMTYTMLGKKTNKKIGYTNDLNLKEATLIAKKIRGLVDAGINPITKNNKKLTLNKFLNEYYYNHITSNQKKPDQTKRIFNTEFNNLLNKNLDEILINDLHHYVIAAKTKLQNSTINKYLMVLKTAFSYAVNNNLTKTSPFSGFKKLKIDTDGNRRFLTSDQQNNLITFCKTLPSKEYLFISFLLNVGLRPGETLKIKYTDFDLDNKLLSIKKENTKSEKSRHVFLNDHIIDLIKKYNLEKNNTEYYFCINPQKIWEKIRKNTNLKDHRLYDLRHTFASNLIQKGVNIEVISKLLGHSSINTTMIYSKLSDKNLIEAINLK